MMFLAWGAIGPEFKSRRPGQNPKILLPRILEVARTVAGLGGSEPVPPKHLAEALQPGSLDRNCGTYNGASGGNNSIGRSRSVRPSGQLKLAATGWPKEAR